MRLSSTLLLSFLLLPATSAAADAPSQLHVDAVALPRCLEQIAAGTGARFIVSPRLAQDAPRCRPVNGAISAAAALDAALADSNVAWRLRDDGVFLLARNDAMPGASLDMLTVEDTAIEGSIAVERQAPRRVRPALSDLTSTTRYDAAELAAKPLARFSQLGRQAPNVYSGGQALSIRGVTRDNDFFSGNSTFFDGIDIGSLLLDDNLLSIDDAAGLQFQRSASAFEYGAGAAGGVVRIDTADPALDPSLLLQAAAGERSSQAAAVRYSGPLLESIGLSGVFEAGRSDDPRFMRFTSNTASNPDLRNPTDDSDRRDRARIKLLLEPEALPGLSVELSGFHVKGEAPDRVVASPFQGAPFDAFDRVSFDLTARDWDLAATALGMRAAYDFGVVQTAVWGSGLELDRDSLSRVDVFSTFRTFDTEDRRRAGASARIPLVAGWALFVAGERQDSELVGGTTTQSTLGAPAGASTSDTAINALDLETRAATVEISWQSERWRASAGARHIDEDFATSAIRFLSFPPQPPRSVRETPLNTSYDLWLPGASLAWTPTDQHEIGVTHQGGYRSGGRSSFVLVGDYAPERLDTTELFWRADWSEAGVRTRLAVFRTEWKNRRFLDTFLVQPDEAFRTRIDGLELEAEGDISASIAWRGGIGLLDARHRSGELRIGNSRVSLTGRDAPDAPRSTLLAGLIWRNDSGWSAAIDAYRAASASSTTLVAGDVPGFIEPTRRAGYTVLDARLGWQGSRLGVALTATNLLDEQYVDHVDDRTAFKRILGEPRQVDLTVAWRW